jgi:hypothetical protein
MNLLKDRQFLAKSTARAGAAEVPLLQKTTSVAAGSAVVAESHRCIQI